MSEEDQPSESISDTENCRHETSEDPAVLNEQLNEALREKDQFHKMAQRAHADLSNFKRRAAEEQVEGKRSVKSQMLLKILSITDDLNRAIQLLPDDAVAPGWLDGILLMQRNIDQILGSEGVTKIEPLGQNFDPWECEAVSYEETSGESEGIVTSVIQDGYKHHDKVLRAAQVVVSKKPEPETQIDNAEEDP